MYGALSQRTVRTYIMDKSQSKFATYVAISLAILILLLSSMKNSKNKNVVCETTGTTIPGLVSIGRLVGLTCLSTCLRTLCLTSVRLTITS